ncbi:MAG: biotin--[acetyl-CoA-carboxylase] ligase [Alphaproteobacteria bacterium]|nr:MAG: biotin--[acetyl-CoA-carboxylase] ligase [Alphaproteobacteria bacterium]
MHLHPDAEAAGVRLAARDTLPSTNADALARARAGERGPVWIAAARQTAGRGRRGNVWTSEPGNLYASLLLTDAAAPARLPELCFVVALAARDSIVDVAPQLARKLKLKWPNDLLLDGAKLAGILIEAESAGGANAAAAGIGVNCAHHPDNLAYPATSLAAHGVTVSPGELLHALSRTMLLRVAHWDRGPGFAEIRSEWLAHAAGIGGDIRVRLADRELTGTFETLDSLGRLMLRLPGGALEAITVGEVFSPARVQT